MRRVWSFLFLFSALSSLSALATIEGRVRYANEVIANRMTSKQPVPDYVQEAARCIAALKVVKAGFIWGGEGSTGLVTCRTESGHWSEPSFFSVNGVSFGLQIGVQFLESVLVFITDKAREILNHATFQLGVDLSVAAGPVGGGGGAGVLPHAEVLSYQYSVGLYAGATVNGFVLSHDPAANRKAYGMDVAPATLLRTEGDKAAPKVMPFVQTMERYFP